MKDAETTKLHVVDKQVWVLHGDENPLNTGLAVEEFIESPHIRRFGHFRLIGTASNAGVIVALYDLKQKEKIAGIEVATPAICATDKHRQKATKVLRELRLCSLAPSQGGFHEVVESDYRSYALVLELSTGAANDTVRRQHMSRLVKVHPAWHSLSFISGIDPLAAASVLATVIDPRWYINTARPDSITKLESYLGLDPKTQGLVSTQNRRAFRHCRRCRAVMQCWKHPNKEKEVRKTFELMGPVVIEGSTMPGLTPADFIWRIWGKVLGIGIKEPEGNPIIADLRASQRFVAFLRHTWLSELYRESKACPERRAALFRPVDFFKHQAEVIAYEQHQIGSPRNIQGQPRGSTDAPGHSSDR